MAKGTAKKTLERKRKNKDVRPERATVQSMGYSESEPISSVSKSSKSSSPKSNVKAAKAPDARTSTSMPSSSSATRVHSGPSLAAHTPSEFTPKKTSDENCQNCRTRLMPGTQALFVEENVARVFCSEECITHYFQPEIERLEAEYHRLRSANDLGPDKREEYAHLRWITLQEADEVWREKTLAGDYRYTLISEFKPENTTLWSVCICLFLRGEPSFLYLAFVTKNESMVDHYRRQERVEWVRPGTQAIDEGEGLPTATRAEAVLSDGLAQDGWSHEETMRAKITQSRSNEDIPVESFDDYKHCLESSLEAPDEVWMLQTGEEGIQQYHFIKEFGSDGDEGPQGRFWYVVIAKDTDAEEEIELLEAFPTRDAVLVDQYRQGVQEVGEKKPAQNSRLIH